MRLRLGIGARIALAAAAAAVVGIGILGLGVTIVGGDVFEALMLEHGESADAAQSMFDASVGAVVIVAAVIAGVLAVAVAAFLGRMLGAPLRRLGAAAHRVADGDLTVRVAPDGPPEVAELAASFNRMAAELAEQERLRRDFIVGASHELRTPLTNLTGYLEALRDGVVAPDREAFTSLLEETERLTRLAASLDVLAEGDTAVDPPRAVRMDLAASIRAAVGLAGPSAERAGLRLDVEAPAELMIRADPDAVAQVLANLLQNALRYTPGGGWVAVRVVVEGSDARVDVENSGPGIPASDLPHVFERFYRVDKSRDRASGGAGIGLAIVRRLVESMAGRVGATSGDGVTRVWFSLPLDA